MAHFVRKILTSVLLIRVGIMLPVKLGVAYGIRVN